MKALTFSRHFPAGHPKASNPTFFVEQILNSILPRGENGIINRNDISPEVLPYINDFILLDGTTYKHHTIRSGNRWKPGEMASLRVWSGIPYRSKQIEFAQVEVKRTWEIEIWTGNRISIGLPEIPGIQMRLLPLCEVAQNDGLECRDFETWFNIHPKKKHHVFTGQIISWSALINYTP